MLGMRAPCNELSASARLCRSRRRAHPLFHKPIFPILHALNWHFRSPFQMSTRARAELHRASRFLSSHWRPARVTARLGPSADSNPGCARACGVAVREAAARESRGRCTRPLLRDARQPPPCLGHPRAGPGSYSYIMRGATHLTQATPSPHPAPAPAASA